MDDTVGNFARDALGGCLIFGGSAVLIALVVGLHILFIQWAAGA